MTVRRLRELLMQYPDEALVFEDRNGECRELRDRDVRWTKSVLDNDSGGVIWAGDARPSDPGIAFASDCPGFLVLGAWS